MIFQIIIIVLNIIIKMYIFVLFNQIALERELNTGINEEKKNKHDEMNDLTDQYRTKLFDKIRNFDEDHFITV